MAASAVRICSRKKGKANGPSKLEKILLGYHIKLGLRSQGVTRISSKKIVAAW